MNFVTRFILRAQINDFFTEHEADRVSSDSDPVSMRIMSDTPVGEKPLVFAKYADSNIVYGLPREPQLSIGES